MEAPVSRVRWPLAETTNRGNASASGSTSIAESQHHKTNYVHHSTHGVSNVLTPRYASPVGQYDTSEATTAGSSRRHDPSALQPPQAADDNHRLSQVSNESNSSGRSKKNYKTHIGPWQLGKTLGKGSSARVRLCRHAVTNQLAAVKIVNRRMAYLVHDSSLAALSKWDSSQPEKSSGEMRVPMAIEREVAILKLIEHPHIMKLYDIWENRSEIYLILEYIDQGDLFTFINKRGRLNEEVSLYFFRQMISAISYCHAFNICHRDLKPENILITADLQIKIADFGMAALHQTDTHQLATACGSPHYAAPELLKNRHYRGDKADIWSLGVILYAMLAATLPFDDPDLRVMMNKTKKGHYEMPKHLSPEAEDLIRRMLQVNPDRRISLKEIWSHPLVQKYAYLDNYNEESGQLPDTRKGFQYTPVPEQDIDPQLLRQLNSMWHMFREQDLALKLTCDQPNDQKAFYWLLHGYREKQLENFKPELAHSMSDYHHLKPCVWKKRVSTCEFAQPRANGHGRSVSRFTVISNAAETDDGTTQSYDPYRGSRMLQTCTTEPTHAKITVHRDRPPSSGSYMSPTTRVRSVSIGRRTQPNASKLSNSGRPASSRGSMTSLRSNRQGTPQSRGPGLRHKRGVDFSHVRKRSNSVTPATGLVNRKSPEANVIDTSAQLQQVLRSPSPDLPMMPDGSHPKAQGAPASSNNAASLFTEELRHFSSNIAKDCDEAFKSSLIEEDSIAGSLTDVDGKRRDSPFIFSVEGSPQMTPATETSIKPWDSRPLPPLPSENNLHSPSISVTQAADSCLSSIHDGDYAESVEERIAQIAIPVHLQKYGDRRVVSAPAQTQYVRKSSALPSINENKAVNDVTADKTRIVSAPPHTPPKKLSAQGRGVDYLSRMEHSIRVVNSPTGPSPVKMPRPLNVRKKSTVVSQAQASKRPPTLQSETTVHRHRTQSSYSQDSQGMTRKKILWFKRSSKAETENGTVSSKDSQDQGASANSNDGPAGQDCDVTGGAVRKKSFTFPFWKGNKSHESQMAVVDGSEDSANDGIMNAITTTHRKTSDSKRNSSASSVRNIEVKQNWLARLFRVKPATSYLCMAISRRRARQEVALLLRDWRKYGIRGIQVDKQRNIVFAKIGAKNYLHLKEVEFAAEIMTVIEHGKRQPLSIVRFTQERGAASSFHRVVDTIKMVFEARKLIVEDRAKQKMMIKTLNA